MLTLAVAALLAFGSQETEVTLASDRAPLHGTLLTPAAPQAAALILPGSGPTDRNGDSSLGIVGATYRLLAESLAEDGIETLRVDKRGVGESAAAALSESELRFDVYVDDAAAWATELARRTGRPCVWLIGHSEGSQIALTVAARGHTSVCGLVLLAGAGRPAGVVLREQMAGLPEPLKSEAYAVLAELEAGRTVEGPAALASLFRASVQPYLISWLPLDPGAMIATYQGPVLIVQGTTDIQVTMTDADALAAAQPNAERATFEGVNHILKVAPLDRAANIATYVDPALPLAPGVAEAVSEFILRPR